VRALWHAQFSRISCSVIMYYLLGSFGPPASCLPYQARICLLGLAAIVLMNVSHHFGERASIDVIKVAEDVHVLRRAVVQSDQRRIVLQRDFIVTDGDAVSLVQMRDINVVLALVSLDDPVSRKACGATVRMVNDDDLPDPEQMLRDGDGPKRID